jgi:hypothetical protein
LEQLPVKARRPTLFYRTSKLIKRRRSEVIAGLLVAVMLFAIVLLVSGMYRNKPIPVRPVSTAKTEGTANSAVKRGTLIVEAVPWASVEKLVDTQGGVTQVHQETPVRLGLPPGKYTIYLSGPNGQQRTEMVSVGAANPTTSRTPFEVVDVEKLLGAY